MEQYFLIKDLTLIAVFAAFSTLIFSKLKMPLILGYIIVGILLSPVFNLIHDNASIEQIGELGVLFMMFFVGIEFNLEKVKKVLIPSTLGIVFQIISMLILAMIAANMMNMT